MEMAIIGAFCMGAVGGFSVAGWWFRALARGANKALADSEIALRDANKAMDVSMDRVAEASKLYDEMTAMVAARQRKAEARLIR
jgi:hypothetical protein